MNILSIRQPFASALLTGVYDAERRKLGFAGNSKAVKADLLMSAIRAKIELGTL